MSGSVKTKKILFFDDYEWLFLYGEDKSSGDLSCFMEAYNTVFTEDAKPTVHYFYYDTESSEREIKSFVFSGGERYETSKVNEKTMKDTIDALDISEYVTVFVDFSWQENGINNSSNIEFQNILKALNDKKKKIKLFVYSARAPLRAQEFCRDNKGSFDNLIIEPIQFNRAEINSSLSYFKNAFKAIL